jgi:hypothetical protein
VIAAKAAKVVKPPQGPPTGAASAKPVEASREKAAEPGAGGDAPIDGTHARAPKHSSTLQLTLPKKLRSCSTLLVQIEDPTFDLSGTFIFG